jgi:hypothetical protein
MSSQYTTNLTLTKWDIACFPPHMSRAIVMNQTESTLSNYLFQLYCKAQTNYLSIWFWSCIVFVHPMIVRVWCWMTKGQLTYLVVVLHELYSMDPEFSTICMEMSSYFRNNQCTSNTLNIDMNLYMSLCASCLYCDWESCVICSCTGWC